MVVEIDEISNEAAIDAVRFLGEKWLKTFPLEAFKDYHNLVEKNTETYFSLPNWIRDNPHKSSEAGEFSRLLLKRLSSSDDPTHHKWSKEAVEAVSENSAQALDPLTIAVIGTFTIGIILAVRVKSMKDGTFYEGFPKEFADTVKAITRTLRF